GLPRRGRRSQRAWMPVSLDLPGARRFMATDAAVESRSVGVGRCGRPPCVPGTSTDGRCERSDPGPRGGSASSRRDRARSASTVTVGPRGNVVTVDVHDVAVVDDRPAPAGETPATVSLQMTWKGRGGGRHLRAGAPAFAGLFFRHTRARGTFSGAEDGFGFASD